MKMSSYAFELESDPNGEMRHLGRIVVPCDQNQCHDGHCPGWQWVIPPEDERIERAALRFGIELGRERSGVSTSILVDEYFATYRTGFTVPEARSAVQDGCRVNPISSRICSRGTKCCTSSHT